MKIIHTSDWHIGQTLYQFSREEEHKHFFNQLKDIILEEHPDVLLVAGDIFHSATPSVVSQRLYYHSLVELSLLDADLQIVIVAGNHDSASRLEAPHELWSAFKVSVIGHLDYYRNDEEKELPYDASKIQIPIKRNDEIIGWVLAVPYITAGNYPSLEENDTCSNRVFSFYKNLKDNLKSNPQYKDNHSIITTGHFMLGEANLKNKDKIVGGIESVDSAQFTSLSDIDYWAFGHIHHPQNIGNSENMRYSGSPFALTFNEDYQHSVTVVNIENHILDVKVREIDPLIPIVDFPFKAESHQDALTLSEVMQKLPEILDKEAYVRLHVKSETSMSELENARIIDSFKDKKAKYCGVQVHLPVLENSENSGVIKTLDEFRAISPYELGCSVYKKKYNIEMPDEMKAMFKDVCDNVIK